MWQIYKKEFLELARDKKTLIFTILLPTLILPVILFGFGFLVAKVSQNEQDKVLKFAVIGNQQGEEIVSLLKQQEKFEFTELSGDIDPAEAVRGDQVTFIVEMPDDTLTSLSEGKQANIKLYFNDSSKSNKVFSRVKKAIKPWVEQHKEMLLQRYNLTEETYLGLSEPVKLVTVDTADKREGVFENIGGLVTYFLIIITLTGAMYPALDLGIGEKERGTLETLLITPVARSTLVISKFLVIFTTGFISVFLSIASVLIWTLIAGMALISKGAGGESGAMSKISEFIGQISTLDFFLMFMMLVPVAAIFASVLFSISIYARNFKEAQNYMSPLMMVVIFPIMLTILPGIKLDSTWAWVPLTNVGLAIKEILKGTVDYGLIAIIFVSTSIVAGGLLYFCVQFFKRESVLFRS